MKFLISQIVYFLQHRTSRRNIRLLARYLVTLAFLLTAYSIGFHLLMEREGQHHTWLTGLYWTLTVMSTLGFGDITFTTDLGRAFSILVLLSGMVYLLVLLPFTFIEFFYAPWMEAQSAARAPRELPGDTKGHVILTHFNPVTNALINRLNQYGYPYVLVVRELEEALKLVDQGIRVLVGEPDLPETYKLAQVDHAALVSATGADTMNTNVAFTVRELSKTIPIITTANEEASIDILKLAGATHVVQLCELMGQSLARRTIGGDAETHVIGHFDKLYIAEATAAGTPLVGKTLAETRLRALAGVTVVGVWERGRFEIAGPNTRVTPNTVLVLAGSAEQLRQYDELFCIYHICDEPVVIIGGGRVGRATGRALEQRRIDYRIIEKLPERVKKNAGKYVVGNAADLETLEAAGLMKAPAVIITPHDDDTNIYLTIYCRKLRPDIQIISRATRERNISTLHRAGADFVMSYATMGASIIFNLLKRSDLLMVAEGLNVIRVDLPPSLAGRTIAETSIRAETGCTVVAVNRHGEMEVNPDPTKPLEADAEIILIGTVDAEKEFLKRYATTEKS
jgi:voltage-gated potassium channel